MDGVVTAKPLSLLVLGLANSPHEASRAEIFARFGHKVTMISQAPGNPIGVKVVIADARPFRRGVLARLALAARTAWAILTNRAEVTHAHYVADYGAWIAAFLRRRPLVLTVMGGDVLFSEQGSMGRVGRWLTCFALRRADMVTVKSTHLRHVVAALGVRDDRIMEVVWGVDLDACTADAAQVAAVRAEWQLEPGDRVVLSPRMLKPFYNHHLAIEALPGILSAEPAAMLVLMDYGTDREYLDSCLERAAQLSVRHRVRVVMPRSLAQMPAAYAAAEVVISLPPSDGLPQTVMEAAAMFRPTVITDLDRFHDIFTDGENVIFTRLEVKTVTDKINHVLTNPAISRHVAQGARKLVECRGNLAAEARRVEARMLSLAGRA